MKKQIYSQWIWRGLTAFILGILLQCKEVTHTNSDTNVILDNTQVKADPTNEETISILKVPDIEGKYDLVEGYGKALQKEHDYTIYKGTMLVHRISEKEFGFIKVIKRHQLTPIGEHGIFTFYNDQFYKKEIDYPEKEIYHALSWNVRKQDDILATIEYTSNITTYSIWKKSKKEEDIYISLRKTLQEEKKAYAHFYEKIYHDSTIVKKDTFNIYKTGKKITTHDSIFETKWKGVMTSN